MVGFFLAIWRLDEKELMGFKEAYGDSVLVTLCTCFQFLHGLVIHGQDFFQVFKNEKVLRVVSNAWIHWAFSLREAPLLSIRSAKISRRCCRTFCGMLWKIHWAQSASLTSDLQGVLKVVQIHLFILYQCWQWIFLGFSNVFSSESHRKAVARSFKLVVKWLPEEATSACGHISLPWMGGE